MHTVQVSVERMCFRVGGSVFASSSDYCFLGHGLIKDRVALDTRPTTIMHLFCDSWVVLD